MNNQIEELIKISKDIDLFIKGQNLRNILSYKNIIAEDIVKPQTVQEQLQKTTDKMENAQNAVERAKFIEQLNKKLQTTEKIAKGISDIRDTMAEDVKDWNKCLEYILNVFKGNAKDAFPNVIKALTSSQFFKSIGKKLLDSFDKVYNQVKDYNMQNIKFNKFKELVDDKDSGYMENLIDPFVEMYNGYMNKFEDLQQEYLKIIQKYEQETENAAQSYGKAEIDGESVGESSPVFTEKIEKKHKFSKKINLAKQLIQISQILDKLI